MALQGTLGTFALPDVLRLLASTKKTGRLRLSGDRGSGSLWVDVGGVVDAEASGATGASKPADVLFELLRYAEGSFTFESGSMAPRPGERSDVEALVATAEQQLEEWRDIEVVVPSLDAWVTLAPALPRDEVLLDASQWRTIATVGSGITVEALADALALGEVAACRLVKELVERGLGAVSTDHFMVEPVAEEEIESMEEDEPTVENVGQNGFSSPAFVPPPPPPAFSPVGFDVDVDVEVDGQEVARQLATLSPKAARAVAAAARAETEEEREAALSQVTGDDDTPINRGMLLKFLGSVKS